MNKRYLSSLYLCLLCLFAWKQMQADPLPSWNEGAAKHALLQFVREATQEGGENFIPLAERIATFDEDGTLWVEQPLYVELFFVLDRIRSELPKHPEWRDKEPFKSLLMGAKALDHLSKEEIVALIVLTHTGMTVDAFHRSVSNWLETAIHPRFKRPFTELVYQPMLEVMQLLREHGFSIYIVSGGGQEFIRAFAQKVYGIPPGNVIGSAGKVKYEYQNGQPVLIKLPEIMFIDNREGKPEGINLIVGKRPVAAFGNSIGDQQMLEWTQAGKGKNLELLVHHDDPEREYAYGPESKIGTFSHALMEEAKGRHWIVVSMKKDWKVIFPWQQTSDFSSTSLTFGGS
jgi:phosphoglycolate phosphatase-like HAD superfamily hydrolase